jgi:hypothetical protein
VNAWRGVIMQLANLAALVYLATHAGESELARYALGVVGISTILSHTRARLDAGLASAIAAGAGGLAGGAGGGIAQLLVPSISAPPLGGGGMSTPPNAPRSASMRSREAAPPTGTADRQRRSRRAHGSLRWCSPSGFSSSWPRGF